MDNKTAFTLKTGTEAIDPSDNVTECNMGFSSFKLYNVDNVDVSSFR